MSCITIIQYIISLSIYLDKWVAFVGNSLMKAPREYTCTPPQKALPLVINVSMDNDKLLIIQLLITSIWTHVLMHLGREACERMIIHLSSHTVPCTHLTNLFIASLQKGLPYCMNSLIISKKWTTKSLTIYWANIYMWPLFMNDKLTARYL